MAFACDVCVATFTTKSAMRRHGRMHEQDTILSCQHCDRTFYRRDHYTYHVNSHSQESKYACSVCKKVFCQPASVRRHIRNVHGPSALASHDAQARSLKQKNKAKAKSANTSLDNGVNNVTALPVAKSELKRSAAKTHPEKHGKGDTSAPRAKRRPATLTLSTAAPSSTTRHPVDANNTQAEAFPSSPSHMHHHHPGTALTTTAIAQTLPDLGNDLTFDPIDSPYAASASPGSLAGTDLDTADAHQNSLHDAVTMWSVDLNNMEHLALPTPSNAPTVTPTLDSVDVNPHPSLWNNPHLSVANISLFSTTNPSSSLATTMFDPELCHDHQLEASLLHQTDDAPDHTLPSAILNDVEWLASLL